MKISQKTFAQLHHIFLLDQSRLLVRNARKVDANTWWIIFT